MSGLVLGIDIGRSGAMALLTQTGDLINVVDLPTLNDGPKGRPAVNGALLAQMVKSWSPSQSFVEYVSARPGEAPAGAFAFGRCKGLIEGVLACAGVPIRFLTPPTWKREVGLPAGEAKDLARSQAMQRWPLMADKFAKVRDDGRAEAALIAVAGMARAARGTP